MITDACWLWAGVTAKGYGRIDGEQAHRMMYRNLVGEISDGLLLLHKCDTPSCVNPEHLFVGTQSDNMRDMTAKGRGKPNKGQYNTTKTHCPHGHAYTPDNTYIHKDNSRDCRTCHRNRQNKRNLLKRLEALK